MPLLLDTVGIKVDNRWVERNIVSIVVEQNETQLEISAKRLIHILIMHSIFEYRAAGVDSFLTSYQVENLQSQVTKNREH